MSVNGVQIAPSASTATRDTGKPLARGSSRGKQPSRPQRRYHGITTPWTKHWHQIEQNRRWTPMAYNKKRSLLPRGSLWNFRLPQNHSPNPKQYRQKMMDSMKNYASSVETKWKEDITLWRLATTHFATTVHWDYVHSINRRIVLFARHSLTFVSVLTSRLNTKL